MGLSDTIKNMLEGGVHFGHLKRNWNPKMEKFVFGRKKNIYIIDLEKTAKKLEEAKDFLRETAKSGGTILFVGTKRQIRPVIKELASSCRMPYVDQKWVGGLLTNFPTIKKRLKRYQDLLQMRESGEFENIPGKEVVRLNREISRMDKKYSGLTSLEDLPDSVIVVDPGRERACVREVAKLSIPLAALIDTDSNPDEIDYPIPGNDDAIRSVKFILSALSEAIKEGQESYQTIQKEAEEAKQKSEDSSEEKSEVLSTDGNQKEENEKKTEAEEQKLKGKYQPEDAGDKDEEGKLKKGKEN